MESAKIPPNSLLLAFQQAFKGRLGLGALQRYHHVSEESVAKECRKKRLQAHLLGDDCLFDRVYRAKSRIFFMAENERASCNQTAKRKVTMKPSQDTIQHHREPYNPPQPHIEPQWKDFHIKKREFTIRCGVCPNNKNSLVRHLLYAEMKGSQASFLPFGVAKVKATKVHWHHGVVECL